MPPVVITELVSEPPTKMTTAAESPTKMITTAAELRDLGNAAFKAGDWSTAADRYSAALQLSSDDRALTATIYRNRAIVRLKLGDAAGSEQDCTAALEFDRTDAKALYRRALAREQLDKIADAFGDARDALRLEPKDTSITTLLQRLVRATNEKQQTATSTDCRVRDMHKLAFDDTNEKRTRAMNNLLVLARESDVGAQRVWENGAVVVRLLDIVRDSTSDDELAISAIRILDELVKNHERAMKLMTNMMTMPDIARMLTLRPSTSYIDACGLVIQRMFNALAKMNPTKNIKPDPDVAEANRVLIIRLILELEEMLTDKAVSAHVRETIIDLFLKNLMHMDSGLPRGWSWRFVEDRGLLKLLHVACQIPEQCEYPVTAETRQHLAICLARLRDDMVFDTKRAIYKEKVDLIFNNLLSRSDKPEVRVQLCSLLITMMQGPADEGVILITNDRVLAIMLEMAASDNSLHQSIAAELIVQTASKRERAATLLKVGIPILKKLYDSTDENVKGLCKCASAGGDDASLQTMQEGSSIKLAQTCKRFLLETVKYSVDVRRFACEGLSYLSLDADVKEWIVEDPMLIRALVHLAQNAGALCVYATASIFVNLTNSYDKPKVEEELVKLAQFAKHHVPELHPKDTDDFIARRVHLLVEEGATSACVAVSKTESKNALELLARCLLAFSENPQHRGRILKEGGAKLLLDLTKNATPEGKIKAAHALALLGSNADPSIVFPGQRAYEVVRPLVELLHPDIEGKPNYCAMLTLTNLASVSESVRKRILKERAVPKIEEYWFMTDHNDLRSAAAELLLNLLFSDEFVKMTIDPGTDRLKVWVLYCTEDYERLQMASSAGFAILTQETAACKRILDEIKRWPEIFKEMCMMENAEIQRRCLMGIANMIESDESVAARIIQTDVFRVLVAITKLKQDPQIARPDVQAQAKRALDAAVRFGLIAATDREVYERTHNVSTIREE